MRDSAGQLLMGRFVGYDRTGSITANEVLVPDTQYYRNHLHNGALAHPTKKPVDPPAPVEVVPAPPTVAPLAPASAPSPTPPAPTPASPEGTH